MLSGTAANYYFKLSKSKFSSYLLSGRLLYLCIECLQCSHTVLLKKGYVNIGIDEGVRENIQKIWEDINQFIERMFLVQKRKIDDDDDDDCFVWSLSNESALSHIYNQNYSQKFSPSQTFDMSQAGFEPVQNPSSDSPKLCNSDNH